MVYFLLLNSPLHNLRAALSQIWYNVAGGNEELPISNLHFHSAVCSVGAAQDNSENGKQRKVTAVMLGRVLAPRELGARRRGS